MVIGCPYKIRNIGTCDTEYCPIIRKSVAGFVMCEVDWESCTEYYAMRLRERKENEEYEKQLKANGFIEVKT